MISVFAEVKAELSEPTDPATSEPVTALTVPLEFKITVSPLAKAPDATAVTEPPPPAAAAIVASVVLSKLAIFCNCLLELSTSVPAISRLLTFTLPAAVILFVPKLTFPVNVPPPNGLPEGPVAP